MGASPIVQTVYNEHIEHYGEPDESITFDDPKDAKYARIGPERIDVFIWQANENCRMTAFSTIGMSDGQLPSAPHRAELHFTIRGPVSESDARAIARFLANLAMHPFHSGQPLDWWHTLREPGDIPLFKTAKCVIMHPRFVPKGWDNIKTDGFDIHILNVVPITLEELELRRLSAIRDRLAAIDMFTPR